MDLRRYLATTALAAVALIPGTASAAPPPQQLIHCIVQYHADGDARSPVVGVASVPEQRLVEAAGATCSELLGTGWYVGYDKYEDVGALMAHACDVHMTDQSTMVVWTPREPGSTHLALELCEGFDQGLQRTSYYV